jgi:hypothetical protein
MPSMVADVPGFIAGAYHDPSRALCARRHRDQSAKALNHTVKRSIFLESPSLSGNSGGRLGGKIPASEATAGHFREPPKEI